MKFVELADRFSRAIAARDISELEQIWADDIVVWHSFDQIEQSKAENLKAIAASFSIMSAVEYRRIRRSATEEGFVQQHILHLERASDRRSLATPVCVVAKVRSGQFARLDEYVDGNALATFMSSPLLGTDP